MSVQAGMPSSNPSRASTSAPEHCAPISCREGSSGSLEIRRSSATTSRAFTPLPISTTSASVTNSIGRCPVTSTPFIDVTTGVGVVMKASKPSFRHRLISAEAMKLSRSLNPSKDHGYLHHNSFKCGTRFAVFLARRSGARVNQQLVACLPVPRVSNCAPE
ncbi:hypothetical protein ACWKT5_34225 [Streptomyces avermitilis]